MWVGSIGVRDQPEPANNRYNRTARVSYLAAVVVKITEWMRVSIVLERRGK